VLNENALTTNSQGFASSTFEMDTGLFQRDWRPHFTRCLVVSSSGSTAQRPSSRPDLRTPRQRAQ
jgi:hypothetical protein